MLFRLHMSPDQTVLACVGSNGEIFWSGWDLARLVKAKNHTYFARKFPKLGQVCAYRYWHACIARIRVVNTNRMLGLLNLNREDFWNQRITIHPMPVRIYLHTMPLLVPSPDGIPFRNWLDAFKAKAGMLNSPLLDDDDESLPQPSTLLPPPVNSEGPLATPDAPPATPEGPPATPDAPPATPDAPSATPDALPVITDAPTPAMDVKPTATPLQPRRDPAPSTENQPITAPTASTTNEAVTPPDPTEPIQPICQQPVPGTILHKLPITPPEDIRMAFTEHNSITDNPIIPQMTSVPISSIDMASHECHAGSPKIWVSNKLEDIISIKNDYDSRSRLYQRCIMDKDFITDYIKNCKE